MARPIPLIYDCDNTMGVPGCDVDDGLTLLYLLGCPEVDLLGVTCSFGNSTQETVWRNTLRLLEEWGRGDIPVFRGADSARDRRSPAADFLAAFAKARQGELRILVTGSSTNLMGAWELDRTFFQNVKTISMMGGILGPLLVNGSPMEELNCSVDHEAAYTVLTQGRELQIAAAQNCLESYFPQREHMQILRASPAPAARYLENALGYWFQWNRQHYGQSGFVNWDVMAAAQLVHPELFHMLPATISPSLLSLERGELVGQGSARQALLPKIRRREEYVRHVYERMLSAPVHPAWPEDGKGEDER